MTHIHHENKDSDIKLCAVCKTPLHELYSHKLCPLCMERELFNEVKDFIRNNDVKEQDVAEKFNIPIKKVRDWIKEGRIQYKGADKDTISGVVCKICGKPISFGVLCSECHRLQDLQIVASMHKAENAEMRFLHKIDE